MLIADKAQFADARPAAPRVQAAATAPDRTRRMISHGESLFTPGAPRAAAYRVETGALCHYVVWPDGSHDVIEFVFPGDIVGLGSLGEHMSTAQAMVDTSVVAITRDELESALQSDAALATRMASAADREFDYLRRRALQPGLRPVLNRVAAYLIATAGSACRNGETHLSLGDDGLKAMSAMLEIPSGKLKEAFADLLTRGLLAERDGYMVISDFATLEALADA